MIPCSSSASTSSELSKKEDDKDCGICNMYCLANCLSSSLGNVDSLDTAKYEELINPPAGTEPFLRCSIFNNMPFTINFYTKGHKVKKPCSKLLTNLTWCHNALLPLVMRQTLTTSYFKIVDESSPWLGYWGRHLKSAQYSMIKPYQKVNHFPGAFHLGRKDRLWQHLAELINEHEDKKFSIMPYTYILPKDSKRLKAYLASPAIRHVILKPPASARGSGISIVSRFNHVPSKTALVAQHYIESPFIINGAKFDLRVYVYVTSLDPLCIYVYKEGLVRFASVPYSSSLLSYSNQFMHLTNYSINKLSQENGMAPVEKWTLSDFWIYLDRQGYDAAALKVSIQSLAVKALIACECHIREHQKHHSDHELFGMDVLVDSSLKPWLIEMNISPSLQSSTSVDIVVKSQLACDVLNMCGISFPLVVENFTDSINYHTKPYCRHKTVEHLEKERVFLDYFSINSEVRKDILVDLTDSDVRYLISFEDELTRKGNFELVFPLGDSTEHYLANIRWPVYSNLLLKEWQKMQEKYGRKHGIKILNELCARGFHVAKKSSTTPSFTENATITAEQ